jgi:hypothetical protein
MELTEEQKQGFYMLSRVLNKKYPFIVDVTPIIQDFDNYQTLLCLEVKVKSKLLEMYFNQKITNKWNVFFKFGNIFYPNPDEENFIIKEIKEIGHGFYDALGREYHFKTGPALNGYRRIKINQFKLDDTD